MFFVHLIVIAFALYGLNERRTRGSDVLRGANSPSVGESLPATKPGLREKLVAMEQLEASLAKNARDFRYTAWLMLIRLHFGLPWLTVATLGLAGWLFCILSHFQQVGHGWAILGCALALIAPAMLLAIARRVEREAEPKGLRKLLAKLDLADVPTKHFALLLLGAIATQGIELLARPEADLASPPFLAATSCLLLHTVSLHASGLFPSYPSGTDRTYEVNERNCPRLFALVQESARVTGLPMPRRVYLAQTSSMAHVDTYRSQRDLFKGGITELRLGLRHLLTLDQDELRTLVVHELRHQAHRSALRSALITTIKKLRQRAETENKPQLLAEAEQLELRLCCLIRANERESDRASAGIDGPATARCLARIHAYDLAYEDFWENLNGFILRHPTPPGGPRKIELERANEPDFPAKLRFAYHAALLHLTLPGSTHPELADRLKAIGQPAPAEPGQAYGPPARELLDTGGEAFLQRVEQEWVSRIRANWQQQWADYNAQAKLLDTTEADYDRLTSEELRNLGNQLWTLRSPAAALPAFERLHASKPKDEEAAYWTLLSRLEAGIAGAEDGMVTFARAHPKFRYGMTQVAIRKKMQGKEAEAAGLWMEYLLLMDVIANDKLERETLMDNDPILEHDLPPEDLAKLQGICIDYGIIRSAYVCRRRLRHIPNPPEHIIIVQFGDHPDGRYRSDLLKHQTAAANALKSAWQGSTGALWVLHDEKMPQIAQRVRSLPRAKLHG